MDKRNYTPEPSCSQGLNEKKTSLASANTSHKLRIGISKKPVLRESKTAFKQIEHRTVMIDELTELIQAGHALGAICAGHHVYENFIGRQDMQIDIDGADFGNHSLSYYTSHPFFKKFGFLAYSTRTPGHCRLMFRLSRQITNPVQYARYADALVTLFGADHAAVSCVQLWYTYPGCDVAIGGKTLPLTELDKLTRQYSDDEDYAPPSPLADPEELLQQAIDSEKGRNNAGFHLAISLRRLNTPKEIAERYLKRFQAAVGTRGSHSYTVKEALASLDSAYRRQMQVDTSLIDRAERAIVENVISLPVNVRRTAIAILEAMRQVGRTTNVELSLRQIERASDGHVDKDSIKRHKDELKAAGIFRVIGGDHKGSRTNYTLLSHELFMRDLETHHTGCEGGESASLQSSSCMMCLRNAHKSSDRTGVFVELQTTPLTEPNAKIHAKFAADNVELLARFGSSIQAVIAVLASAENQTVNGLEAIAKKANLSRRLVSNAVMSLEIAEMVDCETVVTKGKRGGASKQVTLRQNWRDRVLEIEPTLTTYGRNIIRKRKAEQQRSAYHEWVAKNADNATVRETHDALVARAEAEISVLNVQVEAAIQERKEAAVRLGLDPNCAPGIEMTNSRRERKRRQPVVGVTKQGEFIERDLIPDECKIVTKANQKTAKEKEQSTSTQTVTRLHLGSLKDEKFGTTEIVTVQVKEEKAKLFILPSLPSSDNRSVELWM